MNDNIFRKKSIDRISSPEALNDYLHVTTPAIWVILMVVVVMLAVFFIWASIDDIDTIIKGEAYATDGRVTMIISDVSKDAIKPGQNLCIGDEKSVIDYVDKDSYGRVSVGCDMKIPNGVYEGEILVESIKPIHFLLSD
ncbi:hypothetical protein [Butyrivibrio sp. AE3004]|uniref:hypothetical protein n=1 Tax=Butyrivibrio sp. AE3004 TaxID=1506994 RepID=UPI0004947806|nr:hypothetical protein [Butyrivibrio sp. AE3004]